MTQRTRQIGLAVSGAVLAGSLLVGTTLAQTPPAAGQGFGPGRGAPAALNQRAGSGLAYGSPLDEVAQAVGMTTEELWQAHRIDGKSLAQIAQERQVDPEKVVQAILTEHKDRLDALVTAGQLTQEQADAWLTAMEPNVRAMIDESPSVFGPGALGGRGMHLGPGSGMGPGAGPRFSR